MNKWTNIYKDRVNSCKRELFNFFKQTYSFTKSNYGVGGPDSDLSGAITTETPYIRIANDQNIKDK